MICAILLITFIVKSENTEAAEQAFAPYDALLIPTADPVQNTSVDIYLLMFPPTAIGEFMIPLGDPMTIIFYGGYSVFGSQGHGVIASASLKANIYPPNEKRWGVAAQAQWIGGGAIMRGAGGGGSITAIELMVSSPVRASRVHFGTALHTLPGSEFPGGRYDFTNPQTTLFLSGEHLIRQTSLFIEILWVAVGADEGYDSRLVALMGGKFKLGPAHLKAGTGILLNQFGSKYIELLPAPPILALTLPL
jgi:hypothetical protein